MEKTRREKSCVCVELFLEKFHYDRSISASSEVIYLLVLEERGADGTQRQIPHAGVGRVCSGRLCTAPPASKRPRGRAGYHRASWGHTGRGPFASRASPRRGTRGAVLRRDTGTGQLQNRTSCGPDHPTPDSILKGTSRTCP